MSSPAAIVRCAERENSYHHAGRTGDTNHDDVAITVDSNIGETNKTNTSTTTTIPFEIFRPVVDYLPLPDRLILQAHVMDPYLTCLQLDFGPSAMPTHIMSSDTQSTTQSMGQTKHTSSCRSKPGMTAIAQDSREQGDAAAAVNTRSHHRTTSPTSSNPTLKGDAEKRRYRFVSFLEELTTSFAAQVNITVTRLTIAERFLPIPYQYPVDSSTTIERLLHIIPMLPRLQHISIESARLCVDIMHLTRLFRRLASGASPTKPTSNNNDDVKDPYRPTRCSSCWKSLQLELKILCRSQNDLDAFAAAIASYATSNNTASQMDCLHLGGFHFVKQNCVKEETSTAISLDRLLDAVSRLTQLKQVYLAAWVSGGSGRQHTISPASLHRLYTRLPRLEQLGLLAMSINESHLCVLADGRDEDHDFGGHALCSVSSCRCGDAQKKNRPPSPQLQKLVVISIETIGLDGLRHLYRLVENHATITTLAYASSWPDPQPTPTAAPEPAAAQPATPPTLTEEQALRDAIRLVIQLNCAGRARIADQRSCTREQAIDFITTINAASDDDDDGNECLPALWYALRLHPHLLLRVSDVVLRQSI